MHWTKLSKHSRIASQKMLSKGLNKEEGSPVIHNALPAMDTSYRFKSWIANFLTPLNSPLGKGGE